MRRSKKTLFNVLIVAIVFALMAGTQACRDLSVGNDFLEKPPSEDVTIDTMFSKAEYAKRVLWNAYRSLPYGPGRTGGRSHQGRAGYDWTKLRWDALIAITDLGQSYFNPGGASSIYYPGVYSADWESSIRTKYNYYDSGAWGGIRDAYIFLENVDRVADMNQETKQQLKAEARTIIAFHYINLFRNYGGVPWVDHAYTPNEDPGLSRLTARATLDSIVAVVDRAIPDLPWELENSSNEKGRFTQAAAMGLKVRALLFGASPLYNDSKPYMQGEAADEKLVWYGEYDPTLWQETRDAARDLIEKAEQTGSYHLRDTGNPRQDYREGYYERWSPEVLISVRAGYGVGRFGNGVYRRGSGIPTDNYVDMFPMTNGLPITDPNSGYDPDNPYENRDPRLYETVLVNGDMYRNRTAELWIGGRERKRKNFRRAATGYSARKFNLDGNNIRGRVTHWPNLRLPEIYLSYAEALNEVNGGPTPEAYEYINKVRNRMDVGDLPTGLSQEEFREAVIRERALEFGYEEVRWFDLIRWKREEDFTKTLYGMNIYQNPDGSFRYEQFELPPRHWQNEWSPKWYLSAFPVEEINKQYGLVQNPGWEQ